MLDSFETIAPTLKGVTGLSIMGIIDPKLITELPGLIVALVTVISQMISFFKKKKKVTDGTQITK